MKTSKNYSRIIAIKERSAGNESIGDMWLETKSFHKTTPIEKIVEWASNSSGKLIITIDEDTVKEETLNF